MKPLEVREVRVRVFEAFSDFSNSTVPPGDYDAEERTPANGGDPVYILWLSRSLIGVPVELMPGKVELLQD